jgi:hypothetical protein
MDSIWSYMDIGRKLFWSPHKKCYNKMDEELVHAQIWRIKIVP